MDGGIRPEENQKSQYKKVVYRMEGMCYTIQGD